MTIRMGDIMLDKLNLTITPLPVAYFLNRIKAAGYNYTSKGLKSNQNAIQLVGYNVYLKYTKCREVYQIITSPSSFACLDEYITILEKICGVGVLNDAIVNRVDSTVDLLNENIRNVRRGISVRYKRVVRSYSSRKRPNIEFGTREERVIVYDKSKYDRMRQLSNLPVNH